MNGDKIRLAALGIGEPHATESISMKRIQMELIVAADKNGGIGYRGGMLYHLPEDLKRFRQITMGKTLLMGRGTFMSLPGQKPLPGRVNCVLSRSAAQLRQEYPAGESGPFFYDSLNAFLHAHSDDSIMVIGGGEVYALCLPMCTRAYVTHIHAAAPADTFFRLDDGWTQVLCEPAGSSNPAYDFCVYERSGQRLTYFVE